MIILSAKNLSFSFGASPILSGASFALDESAHCGVVGVNGAGKSTLLQLISGDYAPDEGSVQLSRKLSVGFFRQGGEYGGVAAGGAEAMGAAGVAGAGAMGIAGVAGAGARAAGGAGATDAAGAWATGAAGAGAEVVASGAWATGAGATGAAAGGAGSSGAMGGAGSAGSGGANAYAGAGAGAGAGGAATIGEAVREVFRDVLDLEASMRRLEAELSAVPHGG
ncbi:MAG: ATP-binding cassette domain-containing protein, partial [Clostridiales bacterium]|nr:ATP-binding cassette domain-containing protein [Clostridiales bacterium]